MDDGIIFLQSSCFMAYMEKHKADNLRASEIFQAHNLLAL